MSLSRRGFLLTSAATASGPLITSLGIPSSQAGTGDAVDLTMGYRAGAIRMRRK